VLGSVAGSITITDHDGTQTIAGNNSGAVSLTGPIGSINRISIDLKGGSDTVTFAGFGAAAAQVLDSLTVGDTGAAGTDTVQLAGNVSIDGDFTLNGVENLLLTSSSTIDTEQGGDNSAGNVNFGGAATSASLVALDLTIDATTSGAFTPGTITFGVFSNAPGPQFVHHLTIAGPSTTVITGDMQTSGDQVFNGDTLLAADATLTATNVVFVGTLNDDGVAATPSNLTINTSGGGLTEFGSAVGATPLTSITTNADGSTLIAASVHTTADQTYNDPVTIGGDATLTANNVTFADKLDDDGNGATSSNLTINATGATTFAGAVGGFNALTSLTIDAAGSTVINGGNISTTGSQNYNDAISISNAVTHLTTLAASSVLLSASASLNGSVPGESLKVTTSGGITLNGPIGDSQPLDKLTLQAGGPVTQAAKIVGSGLELLGAGPFTLSNAANDFATLAAATTGAVTYRDASNLTIGAVNATTGLVTGGNDVTLTIGGPLTIANDIIALGKTVDITAAGATETGGVIKSDKLRLLGNGAFTLNGGNAVGTLAANVTGTISYTDSDALSVGAITANSVTTNGLNSNNNDITLTTTGLLTIANDIVATGATIDINAGGVTEAGGVTQSDKLRLRGDGNFTMDGVNLAGTLAANVTGSLTFRDSNPLTVGTVTANAVTTIGITLTGVNLNLGATLRAGGLLTIANDITALGKTVDINAAGVTETGGVIKSDKLRLLGTGTFTLNGNNAVGTLAANVNGALSYTDTDALTIDTINVNSVFTAGINSNGNDVTLTTGGLLTLATTGSIVATGRTVDINAAGATSAGGDIVAQNLRLRGTGAFNLSTSEAMLTLAADITGPLTFASLGGLTVGSVTANAVTTDGINSHGNDVSLQTGLIATAFPLTIEKNITATGKTVDIRAATVTEAGGVITSDKLRVIADIATLTGNNTVNTLADSSDHSFSFKNTGPLTVGSITFNGTTTSGLETDEGDLTLIVGGLLTIANDITAESNVVDISAPAATETTGAINGSSNLRLTGAGAFTLNGNNVIRTLAANVGSLSFTNTDNFGVTIGAVTANATTTTGITATGAVTIAATGGISTNANVTAAGAVQFNATETVLPQDIITVATGVTVQSTGSSIEFDAGDDIHIIGTAKLMAATTVTLKVDVGNADAGVGQNLTIDTTATIITAGGTFLVGGSDNDTISFPSLPGTTFDVKAGAGNDTITVINKNPDGTARLVTIDGQADGAVADMATIRQGGTINTTKRPYFLPTPTAVSIADKVFWDDTGATHVFGLPTGDIDKINGNSIVHNGNMELSYANIEQLNLKTGPGNDDVTADMTAGPLPHILQIQDTGGPDNRFQVEGTAAADNISIGDIGTTLITSGGPLRASFELAGFNRQWVRGNGGNDVIDNISKVPGVLDGGAGDDTINSIVNVANSKLILKQNILNSTINNVTLVLGNLGHDKLFVGSGAVDGPFAAGSVAAALKAFPDKSITFLIGDYKANAVGNHLIQVVAGGEPGDTYFSSSSAFQHGFVALKDTTPSKGIFKFGAGDTIRFSSTIAWLKAQIFVKASLNNLINGPLSRQLAAYTKVVGPTAEGESSFDDISDDSAVSAPVLAATTDVNRDGQITPLDALLIINELNARGSRQLPPLPTGEGEDSLDDATAPQPIFDVNGDGYLSPSDALAVINVLNAFPADNAAATSDSTTAAVDTLMQSPTTVTPTAATTPTQPAINISDALMSLMAIDSSTASKKKSL
jgi:hypothetical protein